MLEPDENDDGLEPGNNTVSTKQLRQKRKKLRQYRHKGEVSNFTRIQQFGDWALQAWQALISLGVHSFVALGEAMGRTKQAARRNKSMHERKTRVALAAEVMSTAVDEDEANRPPIDEFQDGSEKDVGERKVAPQNDEFEGLSNSSLKRRRRREAREALQAGRQQNPSDNDAKGSIVEGQGTINNQNGCLSASQIKRRRRDARMAREAEKKRKLSLIRKPEDENDDSLEPGNNIGAVSTKQLKKKRKKFEAMFQKAEGISQTAAILEVSSELELKSGLSDCNDDQLEKDSLVHGNSLYGLQRGSHGYGVQPMGNLLLSTASSNVRDVGLGALQVLSDETIIDILGYLGGKDLGCLALVSKGMYVFAHQDSLWRTLALESFRGELAFKGCWRETYLALVVPAYSGSPHIPLKIKDFYSDYLFQSWLCASLEIKEDWLSTDNIERRENPSVEDFIRDFEEPNKPVLLRGVIETWPALIKWDRDYLLEHAGDVEFSAGPITLKLNDYYTYADSVEEERPLYIFDSKFGEKAPQLGADYEVPIHFREDLFSVLGEGRPDFRWLIAGPARSGSSFHIDPNSTSAWNAVVRGAKKWVMYPPEVVPPGVYPSPDGADVATPVSITEWFMNFYGETKQRMKKPVECICRAGEVVFVPRGWWHIVINLEESIAITQNYVSRSNILDVLEFLNRPNSKDLVSGTKDRVNLYDLFRSKYEQLYPGSIEATQQKADLRKALLQKKHSVWETVTDLKTGGFKFGF